MCFFAGKFRRILRCDPPFPSMIGTTAQDLLKKLLVKDPHRRLGSGPRGAEDIKAHPFFKVDPERSFPLFPLIVTLISFTCMTVCFWTGIKLDRIGREESPKSVQTRAEERTGCGKLCRGVYRDGPRLLSSQHTTKHRSSF